MAKPLSSITNNASNLPYSLRFVAINFHRIHATFKGCAWLNLFPVLSSLLASGGVLVFAAVLHSVLLCSKWISTSTLGSRD